MIKAKDLKAGDRVRMADETVRTISEIAKGFARFEHGGKTEGGFLIYWKGSSDFTQVARSQPCEVLSK